MVPESQSAVVARNEIWTDGSACEPYEAGWAREAVVFVRALKSKGRGGTAHLEISPDGMNWVAEGTSFPMPAGENAVTFGKLAHFGNWLRVRTEMPKSRSVTVLVTIHVKA